MNRLYKIVVILGAVLIPMSLFSKDIKFTASAPKVVTLGERFQLIYRMNEKPSNFKLPDYSNAFSTVSGPGTSTSSSIQIINGKMTRDVTITYTYVLTAVKEGKHTIEAAKAQFDGKTFTSNNLSIEVVKGKKPAQPNQNHRTQPSSQRDEITETDNLFVKVLVSDRNVYLGEHLVATIKIYADVTNVDLAGIRELKIPEYNGFYRQDIETKSLRSLTRENVDGKVYGTGILQKTLLIPQRTGKLTIDPAEIDCVVRKAVHRNARSMFDQFFGPSFKEIKVDIQSQPVSVYVKALPETSKPVSFDGAVGRFDMNASIDKSQVKENEAINLKVEIIGNGNLKLLSPPDINFPPDFEVYDPEVSVKAKNAFSGQSGTKTFNYLMIPRHEGEFRIPAFTFSYFNPNTKKYKSLTSDEFHIKVLKGEQSESTIVKSSTKQDIKYIGKDIRYIKEDISLRKADTTVLTSRLFYLGYGIPFLAFLIFVILRRKQIKENANVALAKNRKANKQARKRLKTALKHLKADEQDAFYEEVLKAMWGYMSDKLTIPVAKLNKENTKTELVKYGIEDNLIDQFLKLQDVCEYARYAPSQANTQMNEIYHRAASTIAKFDNQIK
jgi:hypothetical protein